MNIFDFANLLNKQVEPYKNEVTKERAALLVWFLINYFRVEDELAPFYICDNDNDKGIDGIYIDDQTQEVFVFQCKYSDVAGTGQGDGDLRDLKGSSAWLLSPASRAILESDPKYTELYSVIKRLDAFELLDQEYKLRLVFVTNRRFDRNAKEYIQILGNEIEPWDIDRLFSEYSYPGQEKFVNHTFKFEIDDTSEVIPYHDSAGLKMIAFSVKAIDLVKLEGIQDRTLFAKNVRYGLGRTRVNKDLETTLRDENQHEKFFFYHNGITLLCSSFMFKDNQLTIRNYSIVNGCQSTLSFYQNRNYLTEKIKVLLRVIMTGDQDNISQDITYFTNNQNAISIQDLKSNDKIQLALQQDFKKVFSNQVFFKIKSGEDVSNYAPDEVIENDFAVQLLTSYYLKEPHTAHQKTKIFADNYHRVFDRHVNASLIFILREMYRAIESNKDFIKDEGIRSYKTSRFFFVYVFRLILDDDPVGKTILTDPEGFHKKYKDKYYVVFEKLFKLLIPGFNYYVITKQKEGYFDYKNALRNASGVNEMAGELQKEFERWLVREPNDTFSSMLES